VLFEPVNGYQIRRELMSWEVDRWAHVNLGSIYSCLTTLTKQGLVHRHDVLDGTREVAVHTTSDDGRAELATLVDSGSDVRVEDRHVRGRVPRAGRAVQGLIRDLDRSGMMPVLLLSGTLLLLALVLWWGTATFRRESS
jgi:DNA-binding PadR family transcriptional regulator